MQNMHSLIEEARTIAGIHISPAQLRAFETYSETLLEWNRRMNLTTITDPEGIRVKHFLDSLSCLKEMRLASGSRIIDIGTGAGFPGLPLKIARPDIQLTLVEATGKKADFCRHITEQLKLRDALVLHARAEEVGRDPDHREQYDWALARAVSELSVLSEYLLPLVKIGGFALAQKGSSGPAEAHLAAEALRLLGGAVHKITPVELPAVAETRYLVVLAKTACTPARFPRRTGVPSKQPLGSGKHRINDPVE